MKVPIFLFLLCALGTTVSIAHADDSNARTQIRTFYARKDALEKANDFAGWRALSAHYMLPTFTMTLTNGHVLTLPQVLAEVSQSMKDDKPPRIEKTTLLKLSVNGMTATEQDKIYTAGSHIDHRGIYGPKGKTHRYTEIDLAQVKWVKQAGIWKAASVKFTRNTFILDGKPFTPPRS